MSAFGSALSKSITPLTAMAVVRDEFCGPPVVLRPNATFVLVTSNTKISLKCRHAAVDALMRTNRALNRRAVGLSCTGSAGFGVAAGDGVLKVSVVTDCDDVMLAALTTEPFAPISWTVPPNVTMRAARVPESCLLTKYTCG